MGLEETLLSFGGRLPSGTEIGLGGHPGETLGAGLADLAYKGLGDTVPPHSRAFDTVPSACYALRVLNRCCNNLISFKAYLHTCHLVIKSARKAPTLRPSMYKYDATLTEMSYFQ